MQTRLLARHFLWRFLDNDLIAPDSDIRESATLVLAVLAVPSLLLTGLLMFEYSDPWLTTHQRMVAGLSTKLTYVSWSMVVMALVTLIDWDALSLDARDYAILGPLPIPPRALVLGKIGALALFVSAVAGAVNAPPTVLFPMMFLSSSSVTLALPYAGWLMLAHAIVCLGAAVFGFLAIVALRGLLLSALSPGMFRRLAVPVQFVAALGLAIGFFRTSVSLVDRPGSSVYLSPPMWFLGLYETLTAPVMAHASRVDKAWQIPYEQAAQARYLAYEPVFHRLALAAVGGLVIAGLAACALYAIAHFRRGNDGRQQAAFHPGRRRRLVRFAELLARRTIVRDPIVQGGFFFTLGTLARSGRHRLYVAGYVAVGALLTYFHLASLRAGGAALLAAQPSVGLFAIQFVLSFFLIIGVRAAFTIPAELRANWTFRLLAAGPVARHLAGVRRAIGVGVIVPFFVALLPLHALVWGRRIALLHLGLGILWALVLAELLLVSLQKMPFTCSKAGGKANLKVMWPVYLAGFCLYCYAFAWCELNVINSPRGSAVLTAVLFVTLAALWLYGRHAAALRGGFVFVEADDPAAIPLGLEP